MLQRIYNSLRGRASQLLSDLRFGLVDAYLEAELRRVLERLLKEHLGGALHERTRKRVASEIARAALDALWRRLGIESGSDSASD
ncbi:MAG: hypothetical protein NZ556_07810 [Fimbriimonadales bacterium]|nr:hypothetical protein [Fimbriimonadales bacterium]